jgi:endonuclease/exonuclease/phosphatase family metal-dependent hydrolase
LCAAPALAAADLPPTRVCTFNIRAPVDPPPNDWAQRKGKVAQVIVANQCAIVGLQEALHSTVDELMSELNSLTTGNTSYCLAPFSGVDNAIVFHCSMALIATQEWALSDTPDKIGSNTWGLAYARTLIYVKLKLTLNANLRGLNSTFIYMYATHLDIDMAKLGQQVDFIIARMKDSYAHDGRVVVVGDFNAGERSIALSKFNELGFEDTLPGSVGSRGTFNGFSSYGPEKIDYVLATPCANATDAAVVRTLVDNHFPSDHAMVMADVTNEPQ